MFFFSEIISASLLKNFLASRPVPPVAENTYGVNDPGSDTGVGKVGKSLLSKNIIIQKHKPLAILPGL